ncbi:hypothetical protein BSLG_003598 [Batrachochytrium salamandrivorans]|nr:hypothetical protein BSLG_003598 [Batrachochytrium salamandrivorans]
MSSRHAVVSASPRPAKGSEVQDDIIDRTPEYNRFMQSLEDLHQAQGTILQREPVLGGKNLDLLKIYKMVIEAGGYELVTHERGWKKIGIPFDLPTTCTNSAFVFKQIYQKYLYCYELTYSQTRSAVSGADGIQSTVEASVGTPGRTAATTTNATTPHAASTTTLDEQGYTVNGRSAKRARFEMPNPPQPQESSNRRKTDGLPTHQLTAEEEEKDDTILLWDLCIIYLTFDYADAHTISTPLVYLECDTEKYLGGGWQNRLALALRSELPNEVDWAFNKLIKISYEHTFYVGFIPVLPEVLIEHMLPFFNQLVLNTSPHNFETTLKCGMPGSTPQQRRLTLTYEVNTDNATKGGDDSDLDLDPTHIMSLSGISMFATTQSQTLQERVLQSLHIIRNLSFMADNAAAFSKDHTLLTLLAKAIALPTGTIYVEIKQYAMDIYENLAAYIVLRGPSDFYLACLKQMIFESDRGRVVGSLRCLIRLAGSEANEKVLVGVETGVVQRLIQLLLVPDEEVVCGVMEFLYLFSSMGSDGGVRIMSCVRFNVLRLLLKFLGWRGVGAGGTAESGGGLSSIVGLVASSDAMRATRPAGPAAAAAASAVHVDKLSGSNAGLMGIPHAASKRSSLPQNLPSLPAPVLQRPPAYLDPRAIDHFQAAIWLQGVLETDLNYAILQSGLMSEYEAYCQSTHLKALKLPELIKLIQNIYPGATAGPIVNTMVNGNAIAVGATPGASALPGMIRGIRPRMDTTASASAKLVNVIHGMGGAVLGGGSAPYPQSVMAGGVSASHIFPEANDELRGIPLSALLILRNIARHPDNHVFFWPFESDLAQLMVLPRFNKVVGSILAELKSK